MESVRTAYKNDAYGNAIYIRVSWNKDDHGPSKPIALIYHTRGLVAGSSEIVPKTQIYYLCSKGFVVVMPNYRFLPQVMGKEAFADSEEAFDWTLGALPDIMAREHNVMLDTNRAVVLGHSSGGAMALHLASIGKPVKAVTAFYPFIFVADPSTNTHKPTATPPFGDFPEYVPAGADWATIKPNNHQTLGSANHVSNHRVESSR